MTFRAEMAGVGAGCRKRVQGGSFQGHRGELRPDFRGAGRCHRGNRRWGLL